MRLMLIKIIKPSLRSTTGTNYLVENFHHITSGNAVEYYFYIHLNNHDLRGRLAALLVLVQMGAVFLIGLEI